jgi:hypothetical protein
MFKKIISILIVFNLVSHCGFTPIHSSKINSNFSISSLEFEGESVINNYLKQNLNKYKNDKFDKTFKIKIISQYKKVILSKNTAANTVNYELSSEVNFIISSGGKFVKELIAVEKRVLDKNDDNFEEQKEERITKQNFASSMSNKLVTELSLLNDN